MIKRADPPGCACTRCLTGYSKPVNQMTMEEMNRFMRMELIDFSGRFWDIVIEGQRVIRIDDSIVVEQLFP